MHSISPTPGTVNNAVVAAVGCESIVHDIIPTQGHTSLAQLQAVINQVVMESLISLPSLSRPKVQAPRKCSHHTAMYDLQLAEEVHRMDN